MNGIAYAGAHQKYSGARPDRHFNIIVATGNCNLSGVELSDGDIAVVPPLCKYDIKGEAILLCLDQALLPFKEVRVLRDDKAGGIAHAARQAEEYFKAENPTRDNLLAALGGLIVAYVTAFAGGGNLSPVVETVRDEIKKNISMPSFSLEDSIKKLPLNYDYVRKLFKKEMGVTPHEYLTDCRMQFARELISSGIGNRYSNYSVGQIAEACGFSEPLYFSRVFKKYYGFSPSEAVKIWKANGAD